MGLLLLEQVFNGLQFGVMLFLIAAGLTLVFGIMDLVNLSHGSLVMVGAYLANTMIEWTGSFLLGILLALPATFAVGAGVEVLALRTLYSRDHLDQVLATFGLILFFNEVIRVVWGPASLYAGLPEGLSGHVEILPGVQYPVFRLVIILVGFFVAGLIYFIVSRTRLGMRIRAGASNRTMISALGINIGLLFSIVFVMGAVLAGLAGMMIAPITDASIGMGNQIIIVAFVVIVIGGIGSIKGAFIAAIIVGLIDTMGRSYLDALFKLFMSAQNAETSAPAVSAMLIYILMAVILAVRPAGLFGPRGR